MTDFVFHRSRYTVLLGLLALMGCRSDDACFGPACADIPPGAIPQPVGTYNCQWQHAQAARAERDDFVLYGNEWLMKSSQLAPCGTAHLENVIPRLNDTPSAVVVQTSGDQNLDQSRQATVMQFLAEHGVTQAGSRVIIGCPEAEGLYGFEAPRITRGYSQSGTYGSGTGGRGVGFGGGAGGFGTGFGMGYGGGGFNTGGFF